MGACACQPPTWEGVLSASGLSFPRQPVGGLSPGLGGQTPFSPAPAHLPAWPQFQESPGGPAGQLQEPRSPWPRVRVAGHARGGGSTCTGRHLSGCTARPGLPARRVPLVLGDSRSETPRPMEPPRRPTPGRRAGDQGTELRNAPCPADLVPTLCREPAQCVAGAGFAEAAGHTAAGRKSRAFLSPSLPAPCPPAPARRSGLA